MANPFNKDEQEKTEVNPEAEVVVDEKAPAEHKLISCNKNMIL